jgi:hypothetical protein
MTFAKKRSSHRSVGFVLALAALSPAIGCASTHEPPPPDMVAVDASAPEDSSLPVDAFVVADAGPTLIDDAGAAVDAQLELDAGEPEIDSGYPEGVRG